MVQDLPAQAWPEITIVPAAAPWQAARLRSVHRERVKALRLHAALIRAAWNLTEEPTAAPTRRDHTGS